MPILANHIISGFGKSVTLSNLAKANLNRNSKIFEEFAYYLIAIARKDRANDDFQIKGQVYAFDSSTIDLCLNVFWWAKFRKKKGALSFIPCMILTPRYQPLYTLPLPVFMM
jgi:hypothetical protein